MSRQTTPQGNRCLLEIPFVRCYFVLLDVFRGKRNCCLDAWSKQKFSQQRKHCVLLFLGNKWTMVKGQGKVAVSVKGVRQICCCNQRPFLWSMIRWLFSREINQLCKISTVRSPEIMDGNKSCNILEAGTGRWLNFFWDVIFVFCLKLKVLQLHNMTWVK